MLSGFFQWWYSAGFIQAWRFTGYSIERSADFFSLPILIRTWFAPWKNDQLSSRNLALSDQLKVWELNLAGRFIGFLVRSIIIAVGLAVIVCISLLGGIILGLWLFLPFYPVVAVVLVWMVMS